MEYDHGAGRVEELSIVREGEFFGVASSLSGEPYVASVRALRDATVLCLPGDRFREIVETVPAVTAAVERFVSSRRENSSLYMSGVVEYAELGLVKPE